MKSRKSVSSFNFLLSGNPDSDLSIYFTDFDASHSVNVMFLKIPMLLFVFHSVY